MYIKVKVFIGKKESKITRKNSDSFIAYLKEKPVLGQANMSLIKILATFLKIDPKMLRIIKGPRARNKIIEILYDK